MIDDLVSRLRRAVTWHGAVPYDNELAREAADEIERLRGDAASLAVAREQLLVQADEIKRLLRSHYEIERLRADNRRLRTALAGRLHLGRCLTRQRWTRKRKERE